MTSLMNIDFKSRLIESRNFTNHMIGTSNSEEVVKQLSTWLFLLKFSQNDVCEHLCN